MNFLNTSTYGLSRFQGKVAVITASTQGIGFAIANRLAAEGAAVVVSSRRADNVKSAVDKLRSKNYKVEGVVCHVSNAEHRRELFNTAREKFGGVDILISNAGVNPAYGQITTLKTDEQMWDKIFDVNLKAGWLLAKESLPFLRQRKGANILFLSSIAGFVGQPKGEIGAYSVAKTAVLSLTKSIASELGSENIRVNCIAPGFIDTPFSNVLVKTDESLKVQLDKMIIQRPGQSEDVASAAAFLCSDEASFITAENMVVSGGQYSRL